MDREGREWGRFEEEVKIVMGVLNGFGGPKRKSGREDRGWYAVIIPSMANLDFRLSSNKNENQEEEEENGRLDEKVVQNIYILLTALEPHLTLLSTPAKLLRYPPLSHVLETVLVQRMAKEKNKMWKHLLGRKDLSERRREEVYTRGKGGWIAGLESKEGGKENDRGWVDVLLHEVRLSEVLGWEGGSCVQATRNAQDDTTALSFPAYPSTTNPAGILAYTELLASLLSLSSSSSTKQVLTWIDKFRSSTPPTPDSSPAVNGFKHLLSMVHISPGTQTYFDTYFQEMCFPPPAIPATATPNDEGDIFAPLLAHLAYQRFAEIAHIPTYIARYTAAGGFAPTPPKKLYALMVAEEHWRRKAGRAGNEVGRGEERWMDSVKNKVGVDDAVEVCVEGKGKKTPERELGEGEWVRIEGWRTRVP